MAYIYKITNLVNSKVYIGLSACPEDRLKEHIKYSRYPKQPIHFAMAKYGVENFSFEIIEETDNPNEREIYWIAYYNSFEDDGYNATRGGEGAVLLDYDKIISDYLELGNMKMVAEKNNCNRHSVGKIINATGIDKIRINHDHEKVYLDYKSGKAIEKIAEENDYAIGTIRNIIQKKERETFAMSKNITTEILNFADNTSRKQYAQKVTMFDKKTKTPLHTFESQMDAAKFLQENGYSESKDIRTIAGKIGMVCRNERKSCYGFSWNYAITV